MNTNGDGSFFLFELIRPKKDVGVCRFYSYLKYVKPIWLYYFDSLEDSGFIQRIID